MRINNKIIFLISHVVISQDEIITDELILTRFLTYLNKP